MNSRYTFLHLLSAFFLLAGTSLVQAQSNTTVSAWGWDYVDQVTVPDDLGEIIQVSAGWVYSMALRADGTVVAWGDEGADEVNIPADLDNVAQISAGNNHALALRADGTVVGWGQDWAGQATPPAGLDNVVQISAGGFHSLALRADGTVVAWGWDYTGQSTVPPDLTDVVQIAGGGHHSMALLSDGTVVEWGLSLEPAMPADLADVVQISGGNWHSLALLSDGTVVAWGDDYDAVPEDLTDVIQVSGGGFHSLALLADGTVVGWGDNDDGQSTPPTKLGDVVQVAGGGFHSLALSVEGSSPVPVADARTLGSGEVVTVIGTVTRTEGAFTYLQDDTAGLTVRQTSGPFFDAVANGAIEPGTRVRVRGELSAFNGLLQINQNDLVNYNLLGQRELPEPHAITLADLIGDAYQAELVTIVNLTFVDAEGAFESATSYDITDPSINPGALELRVPNENDNTIAGEAIPDHFTFTGVVGYFNAPQLIAINAGDVIPTVSTEGDGSHLTLDLKNAYPNPFRGTTTIEYVLPESATVTIVVYDVTGRRVATLVDEERSAGHHQVVWDGSDLASGVYIYRMQAGTFTQTQRALIVR